MRLWCDRMSSPIGTVLFVSDGDALRALDFEDCEDRMHRLLRRQYGAFAMEAGRVPRRYSSPPSCLFRRRTGGVGHHPGADGRHSLPASGLDGVKDDPGRYGHHVRASGGDAWRAECQPCGRPRQWRQSGRHRCALPSGDWRPGLTGYGGGLAREAWLLRHEDGWPASLRQSDPA